MRKKAAVIFPGIGYHTDKPLLYYGKKLAKACGYEIYEAAYGGFPQDIKGDAGKMEAAFLSALEQTEQMLSEIDFTDYDRVLFISKSVGTAVASAYAGKCGIRASHIYFTPVGESFRFMQRDGIVFHGTADPWVDTETVKQGCRTLKLPLYITEGANHSMETGIVEKDLDTLTEIMRRCGEFLRETEA